MAISAGLLYPLAQWIQSISHRYRKKGLAMIVFGTGLFGVVDRISSTCYVATKFFHVGFPLFPIESHIVLDDHPAPSQSGFFSTKSSWHGIPIGLYGRSILAGYLRCAMVPACVLALAAVVAITRDHIPEGETWQYYLLPVVLGIIAMGSLTLLPSFRRASPERMQMLLETVRQASPDHYWWIMRELDGAREKTPAQQAQINEQLRQAAAAGDIFAAEGLQRPPYPVACMVNVHGTMMPGLTRYKVRGIAQLQLSPGRVVLQPASEQRPLARGHEPIVLKPDASRILVDEQQGIANAEMPDGKWLAFRFAGNDKRLICLMLRDIYGDARYKPVALPHFSRFWVILASGA
jgi:hypothetical protein